MKYIIRYLFFWLPAALAAYMNNDASMLSQVAQWVLSAVFVIGWAINTGMAAYHYPRAVMGAVLGYSGVTALLITALYAAPYGTGAYRFLSQWGGLFSFKPLDILLKALLGFSIPHEFYVAGFLVGACLIGYVAGIVYRRNNPNPYRPRITQWR